MLTDTSADLEGELRRIFEDAVYEMYIMDFKGDTADIDPSIRQSIKKTIDDNAKAKAEKFADKVAVPLAKVINDIVSQTSAAAESDTQTS